jgi:hypothetical protein
MHVLIAVIHPTSQAGTSLRLPSPQTQKAPLYSAILCMFALPTITEAHRISSLTCPQNVTTTWTNQPVVQQRAIVHVLIAVIQATSQAGSQQLARLPGHQQTQPKGPIVQRNPVHVLSCRQSQQLTA